MTCSSNCTVCQHPFTIDWQCGCGYRSSGPMLEFIEGCLRHKCEMVIYEAAHSLVQLNGNTLTKHLAPAVSVLQLFCSSPKQTLRFAAVKTLSKVGGGPLLLGVLFMEHFCMLIWHTRMILVACQQIIARW